MNRSQSRFADLLARLTPPGPSGSRTELAGVVTSLHASATEAFTMVGELTGLPGPARQAAQVQVKVIDRPRWQEANQQMIGQVLERIGGEALTFSPTNPALASVFAALSTRVLGQFDPFHRRLLLVAPNIVAIERKLNFDAMDFRLWVCLHECTHAVQAAAAPWLEDYLLSLVQELMQDASARTTDSPQFEAVTALMSLLEGHADALQGRVTPARIPSARRIRAAVDQRREQPGPVTAVIREIFGMNAKLAQYRDGAAFVRRVVDEAGLATFNRVFDSPAQLPTLAEIHDPGVWIRRITADASDPMTV